MIDKCVIWERSGFIWVLVLLRLKFLCCFLFILLGWWWWHNHHAFLVYTVKSLREKVSEVHIEDVVFTTCHRNCTVKFVQANFNMPAGMCFSFWFSETVCRLHVRGCTDGLVCCIPKLKIQIFVCLPWEAHSAAAAVRGCSGLCISAARSWAP